MTSARREHWEGVYRTKAPSEVSWYQPVPGLSLRMLAAAGATPQSAVIDIGGGASTLVDQLVGRGFERLAVLDISEAALAASRGRLGESAKGVEWIVADVTEWRPTRRFDTWHDRAVFHFLTSPEQRAAYKAALSSAIRVGGAVILATFALDGPDRCSGLPVQRWSAEALHHELGAEFTLVESAREAHRTPGGRMQPFTWARFRRSPAGE